MFDFEKIQAFTEFRRLCDPSVFQPLPEDWVLGMTDVVDSTGAVAEGRYKAVNMAGAAAISATMNALDGRSFPFSFGGDGALVAVPGEDAEALSHALSATRNWVSSALGLELRAALVPVSTVREEGRDVTVARFSPSDAVSYAMFSGGGVDWAMAEMKAGRFHLPPAPKDVMPDLSGLSCRWAPSPSRKGVVLSLIVKKQTKASWAAFNGAIDGLLGLLDSLEREGHPVPEEGAPFAWPPSGVALEAATTQEGSALVRRIRIALFGTLAWVLFKTGWRLGSFDPTLYRRYTMLNSDYRKFEDGLRMTLDCDAATQDAITRLLEATKDEGILAYGTHAQDAAIMTCIVPSALSNRHFHFMDGIDGGYTEAARKLEADAAQPA